MLKYIALGTDCKEYFNYDGKPLPIRPLSTYELDQAFLKAVEGVSPLIFNTIIKMKLDVLDENYFIDLDKNNYKEFVKYYNESDYWIVYSAIKDFQDESFSLPDFDCEYEQDYDDWNPEKPKGYYLVRKMKYIHQLSKDIMSMSSRPAEEMVEVLTNSDGKILASMVHKFHQPLASQAWKLTPLQVSFIFYSRPNAPQILKSVDELPGFKRGTIQEITEQMKGWGLIDG